MNKVDFNLLASLFGAFAGLIGALTGGWSLWKQHKQDKLRIRVVPLVFQKWKRTDEHGREIASECEWTDRAVPEQPGEQCVPRIRIVNLSSFPVSIDHVGLEFERPKLFTKRPRLYAHGFKQTRIEAGASTTVTAAQDYHDWKGVQRAFAVTATGETFVGTNPALKSLRSEPRIRLINR